MVRSSVLAALVVGVLALGAGTAAADSVEIGSVTSTGGFVNTYGWSFAWSVVVPDGKDQVYRRLVRWLTCWGGIVVQASRRRSRPAPAASRRD